MIDFNIHVRTSLIRMLGLLTLGLFLVAPSSARQADREAGRYVGSRSIAAGDGVTVEYRADHVVDSRRGPATVYRPHDRNRRTSSGERYDRSAMTAAHPDYPYDSMVRVTNVETGRRIVVRVNDRLEPGANAAIRLSDSAADRLGIGRTGDSTESDVRIELLSSETVPAVVVGRRSNTGVPEPLDDGVHLVDERPATPQDDVTNPDDVYTLQIGAFSTLDAATALAAEVKGAWVMQVVEDGERVFRVYYGQYDREQQARVAQKRLEKAGRDSFLRTIPT